MLICRRSNRESPGSHFGDIPSSRQGAVESHRIGGGLTVGARESPNATGETFWQHVTIWRHSGDISVTFRLQFRDITYC